MMCLVLHAKKGKDSQVNTFVYHIWAEQWMTFCASLPSLLDDKKVYKTVKSKFEEYFSKINAEAKSSNIEHAKFNHTQVTMNETK